MQRKEKPCLMQNLLKQLKKYLIRLSPDIL
jgi:hypothetical protein